MPRIFAFFLLFACLPLLVGCDPHSWFFEPAAAGFGDGYLEIRRDYGTNLLHPGPSPQEWGEDKPLPNVRSVRYRSQNRDLKAWVYVPRSFGSKKYPALIYCHGGFAGDIEEVMAPGAFIKGGYVVMAPTWRGENGNSGHFEMMFGEVDDAVHAARWLANQPYVDPDNIYMFGHSVGGGISALVSLMNDVPIRHTGSSGGLYPSTIFRGWSELTPFNFNDSKECALRVLDGNTESMQRKHYAFLGQDDYNGVFGIAAKKYVTGKVEAPQLVIDVIPGDHFTSFDEAVKKYFAVVEQDRKSPSPRQSITTKQDTPSKQSTPTRETTTQTDSSATYSLTWTYTDPDHGFRFDHDPTWIKEDRDGPCFLVAGHTGIIEATFRVNVRDADPSLLKTSRGEIERIVKQAGKNAKLLDFEKTKFNGIDCIRYRYSTEGDRGGRTVHANYNFNFGNHCYYVNYFALEEKYEAYVPLFNAVLKSFRLP